ncbi:MAG: ADP-ribosylglycohydrolase family protein [Phormidesmis sp. CAN_BIN44]|nr:ADP-ribosylglycohydrolase family protein [Phormidesmis sp. CAN_BIN44]
MQHALLNRFQATLLGAVLGEAIGLQYQKNPSLKLGSVSKKSLLKLQWAPLTYSYTQQIIHHNRFETVDFFKQPIPQTTAEAMIALLPVALFFHEDRLKLWQNLEHAAGWENSAIVQPELFVVGCTIAAALQERLDPLTLIPTVITHLKSLSGMEETTTTQQLQRVQRLLDEQAGLETALTTLMSQEVNPDVGLALYCFLSTPNDLRLALLRSAQTGARSSVVCAITGALSGAFNSMIGIPIEWQFAIDSWETPSQEITTQSELDLANRLFASWAGVYNPLTFSKEFGQLLPAIAAPQVIRKAM